MFAPLVLPFQITVVAFAIFWFVGALVFRTRERIAWMTLAAILLFIPSCAGVMAVVDTQRYGRFDYDNASEIPSDRYLELPGDATDITVYRSDSGHWAKFTIDTQALQSWIDSRRSLQPDLNRKNDDDEWLASPSVSLQDDVLEQKQQAFSSRFPGTGWTYDPAMHEIHVILSERGGGFTLWHIPASGATYISAAYW